MRLTHYTLQCHIFINFNKILILKNNLVCVNVIIVRIRKILYVSIHVIIRLTRFNTCKLLSWLIKPGISTTWSSSKSGPTCKNIYIFLIVRIREILYVIIDVIIRLTRFNTCKLLSLLITPGISTTCSSSTSGPTCKKTVYYILNMRVWGI